MIKSKLLNVFIIILISGFYQKAYGQFEQSLFETQVKDYLLNCDTMKIAESAFKKNPETVVMEKCFNKFEAIKQALLLINGVTKSNTIKSPSAYYGLLCHLKQAYIQYYYFFDTEKTYEMLKEISMFFDGTKPLETPFDYTYYGSSYTVDSYGSVQFRAEYYLLLGNVCYTLKKTDEMNLNFNKLLEIDKSKLEVLPSSYKTDYKKKETKRLYEQRRANSTFNLYAGTYPLLLLKSADKRNYGAVLNFVGKKSAIELSYLLINQKKDFNMENYWKSTVNPLTEMSFWDGNYSHIEYKIFGKEYGSSNFYQGFLLGTSTKKYNSMQVDVLNHENYTITNTTFNPTEKQFILMYNFGMMFLMKGYGIDAYCGLGASYDLFDQGTPVDKKLNTILNTALKEKEPTSLGLMFRIGITAGINIGNGNMR